MKLELRLWDALEEICEREDTDLDELCTWLDSRRGKSSLTAAMRVFLVSYFRELVDAAERGRPPAMYRTYRPRPAPWRSRRD